MLSDEVVDSCESRRKVNLYAHIKLRRVHQYVKAPLQNAEYPLNDIACRGVSKVKELFWVCGLQCQDVSNSQCCWIQVDIQKVGTAPLPKVVASSVEWNEKWSSCGKPCISKVVFSSRDGQISHASIMKHCWICYRSLPPGEHIIKSHVKATYCKAVLS